MVTTLSEATETDMISQVHTAKRHWSGCTVASLGLQALPGLHATKPAGHDKLIFTDWRELSRDGDRCQPPNILIREYASYHTPH